MFVHSSTVPQACAEAFGWHERPGALERLTPPWARVELIERHGDIHDGDRTILRVGLGPVRRRWVAEHRDYREGEQFRDVQVEGPFKRWEHTHRFEPGPAGGCRVEDEIDFALPGGLLSRPLYPLVNRELRRTFEYRHRTLAGDLAMHTRGAPPMSVLVTGASGFIGAALVPALTTGGHSVRRLTRGAPSRPDEYRWDPAAGDVDVAALEGLGAAVHLAGETVAGRWTRAKKERILRSRVDGTRTLSEALARLADPPRVLVCASAIGAYGDRGDELLTEESSPGDDFLAEVVQAWEAASRPAEEAGIRVVRLRFGIVLSPAGGALRTMLRPFRLGFGGRLGSGRQWMSWVGIDDVVGAIHHALARDELAGAANTVAPNPVTNADFTKTLAQVIRRPAVFPVPAPALRLALGEFAQQPLSSTRVVPRRLLDTGYDFRQPDLEPALRHVLGR